MQFSVNSVEGYVSSDESMVYFYRFIDDYFLGALASKENGCFSAKSSHIKDSLALIVTTIYSSEALQKICHQRLHWTKK
jgi:hypothetical protein